MAKQNENVNDPITGISPDESTEQGLMIPERATPALALNSDALALGFGAAELAALEGEIQADLKGLSVTKITSPTAIIDKPMSLIDAFDFEITDKATKQPKMLVMYVGTLNDNPDEILFIGQAKNSIRGKFVSLYDKIRQRNAVATPKVQMQIPNVFFKVLDHLEKTAGNFPIGLQFAADGSSKPQFVPVTE